MQAELELTKLINNVLGKSSHLYIDTIISPSNTSAIAQAIQIPGISGMENNLVIFEFDKNSHENLPEIIDNISLVSAGNFDIGVLASSSKVINFKNGIHLWIRTIDTENANLLILLSFVILGHPDWRKADIKVFNLVKEHEFEDAKKHMKKLVVEGRLPITEKNIEVLIQDESISSKSLINEKSEDAGFTIIGFRLETLKHEKEKIFTGYNKLGNILFVHSHFQKTIE